jgi:hypothetical protein
MPLRPVTQHSFFDPGYVVPDALVEGTVPWLLATAGSRLFPDWLAAEWRGSGR